MFGNNLWFLAIFFALSFGSWLMNQLREQAKLKRARDESRRQYEEHLRTGRAPTPAASTQPPAREPMSDLGERRQAQLRQLRQQQDVRQKAPVPVMVRPRAAPGPTAPTQVVLGPTGVVIQRGPTSGKQRMSASQRREADQAVTVAQAAEEARVALELQRQRERAERSAAAQRAERAETIATAARRGSTVAAGVRGLLITEGGRPVKSDQLRRVFALNEILGKPVSLRERE